MPGKDPTKQTGTVDYFGLLNSYDLMHRFDQSVTPPSLPSSFLGGVLTDQLVENPQSTSLGRYFISKGRMSAGWVYEATDTKNEYVDTTIHPYDAEVDLSGVAETDRTKKLNKRTPFLRLGSSEIPQKKLREMLIAQYPESEFPDIHRIIESGLLLTRSFSADRLDQMMMSGTDRDDSSKIGYHSELQEKEIVRQSGTNLSDVTYVAQQRLSARSLSGGEPVVYVGSRFGSVMAVYDPRYVARLGSTPSGLSCFTDVPRRALLAVIDSGVSEMHPQ